MSNWVASGFDSEYELYEKNQGGAYYVTKCQMTNDKCQNDSGYDVIKNKNYRQLPKLIRARPKELPRFALRFNQSMYNQGTKNINSLRYLTNPEDYSKEISPDSVFDII
jgi:Fe-S oxidoreductase